MKSPGTNASSRRSRLLRRLGRSARPADSSTAGDPAVAPASVSGPPVTSVLDPPPHIDGVIDATVAERLARYGYVRLGTVLTPEECQQLADAFDTVASRLGRPIGEEWFQTILLPDPDLRAFIDQTLRAQVVPRLAGSLDTETMEVMRVDYSVKPPGPNSLLGPHQDFSIVDERRWTSLYVWIPLTPTDGTNGTLHVLPGSHRFTNRIRSRHVPAVFDPVLAQVEEEAIALDCEPGELIVMVSGVVHFSPPNLTDHVRLAVHAILKPIEAPLVFYFADDETPQGKAERYEVDIDQYIELTLGDRPGPEVALAGLSDRQPMAMSPERFAQGMAAVRADAGRGPAEIAGEAQR